jgi:DnaK suppressor protein
MTKTTTRQLRPLLRQFAHREAALREEIAREIAQVESLRESELEERIGDSADHAETQLRASLENRLIDHRLDEMRALCAARERIENGTFGLCVDCGEAIGAARLAALPTAARCAACQSAQERMLLRSL